MSLNIRTGHTFRHEPTSKPTLADELLVIGIVLPIMIGFVVWEIAKHALSRPHGNTP